jgi:hypothetical protein
MITPSFLAQLRHFTALEKLDLRGVSSVTDAALHHIAACRTLVEINLKRTGITGSGLHELLALDDLQEVDLKECPRLHPRHVPVLAGLPSVRRVGIPIDDDNRLFTYEVRKELKSHFPSECSVR